MVVNIIFRKSMRKVLVSFLVCFIVSSCSTRVYYYYEQPTNYRDVMMGRGYVILKGNKLKYSKLNHQGRFNDDYHFVVYEEETNRLKLINADDTVATFKDANKKLKETYFSNFEVKVIRVGDEIVYKYSNLKLIDTFRLENGVFQYNKKLPIPKYYVSPIASFDDAGNLKRFKNNFVVEYVKDSISYFSDQYFEKMHIFYFYPTIYSNTSHEEILDTSTLSTPIVVGISSVNGVPLYTGTSMPYHEGVFDIQSMACYTWIEINGITRKKIKLLLR